jgi:DNA-binding transcriptional LysR family regulator
MQRWSVKLRGEFYACGPFQAPSLEAAKQWVREWLGVGRLPHGTEIWKTG